jgi:penicillin-binding protein 1A
VAVEDRRFYMHPGIDPLGMVRALWIDLTNQHIDQGGSTLEQQLVKRTIVPRDQSVGGKLRTIALAWAVDQEFGKLQILELYLNAAYYGRGAYGPEAAARIYFGVDAVNLTLPEAAFLAALPQAPSVFGANPTALGIQQRWITVLQDMQNAGDITPQQADVAEKTKLAFAFG